jgi:hypothetical protein
MAINGLQHTGEPVVVIGTTTHPSDTPVQCLLSPTLVTKAIQNLGQTDDRVQTQSSFELLLTFCA